MLELINVFEQWCADMPTKLFENVSGKCNELRQLVCRKAPGVYAPGPTLDKLLRDLQGYRGRQAAPAEYFGNPEENVLSSRAAGVAV